jgi:hypothetical protein
MPRILNWLAVCVRVLRRLYATIPMYVRRDRDRDRETQECMLWHESFSSYMQIWHVVNRWHASESFWSHKRKKMQMWHESEASTVEYLHSLPKEGRIWRPRAHDTAYLSHPGPLASSLHRRLRHAYAWARLRSGPSLWAWYDSEQLHPHMSCMPSFYYATYIYASLSLSRQQLGSHGAEMSSP